VIIQALLSVPRVKWFQSTLPLTSPNLDIKKQQQQQQQQQQQTTKQNKTKRKTKQNKTKQKRD